MGLLAFWGIIIFWIFVISSIYLAIKRKRKRKENTPLPHKLIRVDVIENDLRENIYEIVYIEIKTGKKKKEILVNGHVLYESIDSGELRAGGVF